MLKTTVLGVMVLAGAAILTLTGWSSAQDRKEPAADGAELAGKFLLLNFIQGGTYTSGILKGMTIHRLAGRSYMVGAFALDEAEVGPEWKGAEYWIPLDRVENFTVFDDLGKAKQVVKKAQESRPGK